MTDYRIVIACHGAADCLELQPIEPQRPAPGEAVVRHSAIGVNFIDVYHRTGLYPVTLPSGIGQEAAGVVEVVGDGVTVVKPGDRVAYAGGGLGAYTTVRAIAADQLVILPDGIDEELAAATMVKGLTAEFLVGACSRIQSGQSALVHAAAGGVGSILVQWLKALGVRVIAHAGSAEKAGLAASLGADVALSCPFADLAAAVRDATDGRGVDVCFDGVGAASWSASIGSAARRGLIVSYGNASGPVPPVAPLDLLRAGSLFLTRPTSADYHTNRAERLAGAGRLFDHILDGTIRIDIGQRFPLANAREAHRALEARQTTGSTVLIP